MRALFFEVDDDPRIWEFPFEWFLGDDLLVAPVTEPAATAQRLYLPPGEWVDAWTGEELQGRAVIERDAPLDEIPVYVDARAASLVRLFHDQRVLQEVG